MNDAAKNALTQAAVEPAAGDDETGLLPAPTMGIGRRVRILCLLFLGLALCFVKPLIGLVQLAASNDLYSHTPLIPFISLYLVWLHRRAVISTAQTQPRLAILPAAAAVGLLGVYWGVVATGWSPARTDYLCVMMISFLLLVVGAALALFGGRALRTVTFPLAFLVFMAPFPQAMENGIESFLQHGSAEASHALLALSGTTMFREGTLFLLPGITLEVAPECSGIRSSLVLVITSLLAGYLFLQGRWGRTALAAAVIPLGILRNAIRIFTLAQLCIHVSPDMIDSPLHRRGGPVFFLISLVPLFLLLFWLRRREAAANKRKTGAT